MLPSVKTTTAENAARSKILRTGHEGRRDEEEAVHLWNALRIYENNMASIYQKNPHLTDEGFSAAHKNSSAQAMGHLKDSCCFSPSVSGMLSDMIKVKRQRFKLDNSLEQTQNNTENFKKRPDTSMKTVKKEVHQADRTNGSNIVYKPSKLNDQKLKNIAEELLSSEIVYVKQLRQIDQVYYKKIQEASLTKKIIPEADVIKIFGHVTAIYQFHSNFLLPQLQERLKTWETNPRVGDVMMQAAPFMKMYALYTQNFDESSNLLKDWLTKSEDFALFISLIQLTQENPNLPLQSYMITPIQRIPRYELLLKDYLKRLPDDAMDRQEAESALALIADAAAHSNEILGFTEGRQKLNNTLENLSDVNFDITEASRELTKEGSIKRLDNWEDKQYDSQLYLFSDILLDCAPKFKVRRKRSYKVRNKVDLAGADVCKVTTYDSSYGFCVHGIKSSMEFATTSMEERQEWIDAIRKAIKECDRKKRSFKGKLHRQNTVRRCSEPHAVSDEMLGKQCPRWIKYREVSKCMICRREFSTFRRAKYYCGACAKIVCAECSEHQSSLEYSTSNELEKVCDLCHKILNDNFAVDPTHKHNLLADYLYVSDKPRAKKETKYWCLISSEQPILYFLRAPRDTKAEKMIHLNKFQVACTRCQGGVFGFKLERKDNIYYLSTKDKEVFMKWNWVLTELAKGTPLIKDDIEAAAKQQYSSPWSARFHKQV
ncbi:unnamed protein product [Clavelina lepadiformis]|uniref:Uncharacterized protein n=1 Tax=Clavelina lepadiformis TaxID=159417 RepID=A0ABP0F718_CLALP